jgi:hypothetical protein
MAGLFDTIYDTAIENNFVNLHTFQKLLRTFSKLVQRCYLMKII